MQNADGIYSVAIPNQPPESLSNAIRSRCTLHVGTELMKVLAVLCRKFDHDFNYLKAYSFFCLLVVAASGNAAQVLNI
jgi:hypothetical protein